jgi:hypothetical protein
VSASFEPTSSARPERLLRFERTAGAVAEGMRARAGILGNALDHYLARCQGPHRVTAVEGSDDVLRAWASGAGTFGEWVGDVGRAFLGADVVDVLVAGVPALAERAPGTDEVRTRADRTIRAGLAGDWDDPHLGVAEGRAARLAADLGLDDDQDAPPSWHRHLESGGKAIDIFDSLAASTAEAITATPGLLPTELRGLFSVGVARATFFDDGTMLLRQRSLTIDAHLRLPSATATASRLNGASKWLGRTGNVLTFATGAQEQWERDAYLDDTNRAVRAGARGFVTAGSAAVAAKAGLTAGATIGLGCGPWAIVCSPVLGTAGGVLAGMGGAWAGNKATDRFRDMAVDDATFHDRLTDHLAMSDDEVGAPLGAHVDLLAASEARDSSEAVGPSMRAEVERLLPSQTLLEHGLTKSSRMPTTTTATTVPDWTTPAGSSRDPWPTRRPYE